MTVSVITSSIGRKELSQCVESVRSQTYKCRHYVYINGERFHASAREILKDYPEVIAFYLPEETGDYGYGPSCNDVFPAAPALTRADWIFYLNDDDFYDQNHVESIMAHVKENDLKWAYSLRKFVDIDGNYICDDNWNSLGHYPCLGDLDSYLVDNSCFAVSRELAIKYGPAWRAISYYGDRCFLMALKESRSRYGWTGLSTVNYRIGTGSAKESPEFYLTLAKAVAEAFPGGYLWRRPGVYSYDV